MCCVSQSLTVSALSLQLCTQEVPLHRGSPFILTDSGPAIWEILCGLGQMESPPALLVPLWSLRARCMPLQWHLASSWLGSLCWPAWRPVGLAAGSPDPFLIISPVSPLYPFPVCPPPALPPLACPSPLWERAVFYRLGLRQALSSCA